MNDNPEISTADAFDRHRRRIMLAMLMLSLVFVCGAAENLIPEAAFYLDRIAVVLAVAMMGTILSVVYWKLFKLPRSERELYFSADGFVTDSLNRAQRASWCTTFLGLVVLIELSSAPSLSDLPAKFFLQVAAALMLGVVSIVFFYLNRADEAYEAEQDSSA